MTAALGLPDPHRDAAFYEDTAIKRGLAWVVDVIAITSLSLLLTPLTLFTSIFYFPVFYVMVGFAYRTVSIAKWSGTPGMRLMSVELRDASGARFDLPQAALHTLGYTVSWAVFPLQLLSGALMLGTARKQGLSDLVLGSAAINRSALDM
ncbi:RDD family protein [Palleronia marisminoris]|uniref:RDD family protein n=1 Tax=Palleronia marisminoris TaxID=315423 RepID=A0A1Y5RGP9_9RHOB|nr:RDD family protein [Palleronia marisminoris]SFG16370.1 RDD family protein [Palleronia marisminoris]SLN16218.1 RDD family protein [Palleronia marisminoris]